MRFDISTMSGLLRARGMIGGLDGREVRMKMQDRAFLAAFKLLFLVGVHQERERDAIHATRRLDHVRSQMLIRRRLEIGLLQNRMLVRNGRAVLETRPAAFRVAGQVVVRAVCDAFNLVVLPCFFAFRKESIEQIGRRLRVVREFLRLLRVFLQVRGFDAVLVIPGDAIRDPPRMPFFIRCRASRKTRSPSARTRVLEK